MTFFFCFHAKSIYIYKYYSVPNRHLVYTNCDHFCLPALDIFYLYGSVDLNRSVVRFVSICFSEHVKIVNIYACRVIKKFYHCIAKGH